MAVIIRPIEEIVVRPPVPARLAFVPKWSAAKSSPVRSGRLDQLVEGARTAHLAPAELFSSIMTASAGLSSVEKAQLVADFRERMSGICPGLPQLIRAHLRGIEADIAREAMLGFDPSTAAASFFSVIASSSHISSSQILRDRLRFLLCGRERDPRPARELAALVFAYEFPYQRSFLEDMLDTYPELRRQLPRAFAELDQKSCPTMRKQFFAQPAIASDLCFSGIESMTRATLTMLYVLGQQQTGSASRQLCRRLVTLPCFESSTAMSKQILLDIFFTALPRHRRAFIEMLETPQGAALLSSSSNGAARSIDIVHELCVGPLSARTAGTRREILADVVSTVRNRRITARTAEMPNIPPMEKALENGDFMTLIRLVRDLCGPSEDSWTRDPDDGRILWWGRSGAL